MCANLQYNSTAGSMLIISVVVNVKKLATKPDEKLSSCKFNWNCGWIKAQAYGCVLDQKDLKSAGLMVFISFHWPLTLRILYS